MLNFLNHEEQYATGFVRPKTTSVFFDKILITHDLLDPRLSALGYADVPDEVLLFPRHARVFADDTENYLLDLDITKDLDFDHVDIYALLNDHHLVYKYSTHRNNRIQEIIECCQCDCCQYFGKNIVPIYFSPTDFERHFLFHNENEEYIAPVISICINQIPEIVEEKLSWEQVLNIRSDRESIRKIRHFKNWITLDFANKNEAEIRAMLEKSLDDYSFALKKHGIETTIGAITAVNSIGVTLAGILSENPDYLLSGIIIGSGITAFAVKSFACLFETRRHPIAIIYDLIKTK